MSFFKNPIIELLVVGCLSEKIIKKNKLFACAVEMHLTFERKHTLFFFFNSFNY